MLPYHQRRNSPDRLAAITDYLGDVSGLRVLEFGALDGWFSQQLAAQGARCTAVDDSPHLSEAPSVEVIKGRLSAKDIRQLGPFDVVVALSVLHHVPQWKSTLNALLDAAPVVFCEVADPAETLPKAKAHNSSAKIAEAVIDAGGVELTRTPGYDKKFSRPLYVVDKRPTTQEDLSGDFVGEPEWTSLS